MLTASACGGDSLGTLSVTVRLETETGESRACADFGANQLELTFYRQSGDQVPYDVATVDCEAAAAGRAVFALALTAQTYDRVVLRFITETGDTARICTDQGRVEAVLERTEVGVEAGVLRTLDFVLVGESLPCENQ